MWLHHVESSLKFLDYNISEWPVLAPERRRHDLASLGSMLLMLSRKHVPLVLASVSG